MALTAQQMLMEAKVLIFKLKLCNEATDDMLSQSQDMENRTRLLKQCAGRKPRRQRRVRPPGIREMSLTVQQIVMDAKNLASKLKESNNAADALLSQGQYVHKQIDTMKQYADEVGELNESARHRPHTALVAGIQQENRHLRDLQQENRELRAALEEQQNALELIMSKYRQQITKLVYSSQIDLPKLYNKKYTNVIIDQAIKIREMTEVMRKAIDVDDEGSMKTEEELHRLSTENEGLRQLLSISNNCDSINCNEKNEDDAMN